MSANKERPVCGTCRSTDVLADAFAEWDVENQEWALQNTFSENGFCNTCEETTSIEWEDIE